MKHSIKRFGALLMALSILFSFAITASAATVPEATIDFERTGSIDIYKYDLTRANADDAASAMIDSYVSTGVRDTALEAVLDNGTVNNLGNGQQSFGYAVKGVEFSYLKVADICTYSETEADGTHKDMVLYKFDDNKSGDLLAAIGLTNNDAYPVTAAFAQSGYHFFVSDTLIDALNAALAANATGVKDALESYMAAQNAAKFAETDEHGHTSKDGLELGLYLIIETKVPEMVTDTTNPFFASVPMTSVNGTNASNGGQEWLYNITLYPKNSTGIPTLEKVVRESRDWTGKNNGGDSVEDGYAHNATGSTGDEFEYEIISKLPAITSATTRLAKYDFVDTLSKGLAYNRDHGVAISFYQDAACTQEITSWYEYGPTKNFNVTYGEGADGASTMTITLTAKGLQEINTSNTVHASGSEERGYSNCYLKIFYTAHLDSVGIYTDVVYGDDGNPNTVVLTWQRSNMSYFDTLVDDCHIYTYVLDLTKQFSDGQGDATKVQFKLFNSMDNYWVIADEAEPGVYYVKNYQTGALDANEEAATVFSPNSDGKLMIYGLEDDTYVVTEIQTDNGYTLLRDGITIVITAAEDASRPCGIYGEDVLGLVQNDPRYRSFEGYRELAHVLLTASATVDGDAVQMKPDGKSTNAILPLTVVNTRGPELPKTGDDGVWRYSVYGILMMVAAAAVIVLAVRKKKPAQDQQ